MSVFGDLYARYYELLYRDKDYDGEAEYIDALIRHSRPDAMSVLELGCGTGKHAALLAEKGYAVHGVERSEAMLSLAGQRKNNDRLRFTQGDIRSFRLNRRFDAVIALFHVINYLTGNDDLLRTFKNVHRHLKKGGVFVFDCWYGPAVLTDRPSVRIKRLEDEELELIRLADPVMAADRNLVDVNYCIFARHKNSGQWRELRETHRLRYLFTPEIEWLLSGAGMTLESCFEFRTGKEPGFGTWNVLYVSRKA